MSISISYAITVCSELTVVNLIEFIDRIKKPTDEIVVLLDKPKCDPLLLDTLYFFSSKDHITLKESKFNGDFAEWKNELNNMCKGDYIFNIDADEMPHIHLMCNIHEIIENNKDVDLFWIPRINTLQGKKEEIINYVKSRKWTINEQGWINWCDLQGRIFKNESTRIKWSGKIHEKIIGIHSYSSLPIMEEYSLYHHKTLTRQIKQNELYENL
jgi:hypothetical protein